MAKKVLPVFVIIVAAAGAYLWFNRIGPFAPSATQTTDTPPPIQLENGKATIRISQRKTEFLPGSGEKVRIHLSDITSGQVEVTVSHEDGRTLVGPKSMKQGDIAYLKLGPFNYSLTMQELHNKLVGDDYAIFEIAAGKVENPNVVIEKLIARIKTADITFIRNGSEHTPEEAAAHVTRKWHYIGSDIKTPEDFIEKAASVSSTSGEPYQVRLKDGTVMNASPWLHQQLKEIRKAEAGEQPSAGGETEPAKQES